MTVPANMVNAGPATGSDADPTFRRLTGGDLPMIALGSGAVTGNLTLEKGGTGRSLALDGPGVLLMNATGDPVSVGRVTELVIVQDQRSSGTSGGTSTSGAWVVHPLNTKTVDTGSIASLYGNEITLQPGTYRVRGWAISTLNNGFKTRLRNMSDGVTYAVGSNGYANGTAQYAQCESHLEGRFTITAPKTFQLQYFSASSAPTVGLGAAVASGEPEVYAGIEFEREIG